MTPAAVLCAFDLLNLDGEDLRRTPIETTQTDPEVVACAANMRASCSTSTLPPRMAQSSIAQACTLGCEGIVSKRLGSSYRSGRADCLGQGQEPGRASRAPRGRGRLGPMNNSTSRNFSSATTIASIQISLAR